MDEADYWHNHASNSLHESSSLTEFSTSSISDLEFFIRIRPSFIPLSGRRALDALLTYSAIAKSKSKENSRSHAKASSASCQQTFDLSIAKLAQVNIDKQPMGVINYNGPAGYVQDSSLEGLHGHPHRPLMNMSESLGTFDPDTVSGAGVNHRTSGNLSGAEQRTSVLPASKRMNRNKLQNASSNTRKPRFTVRTVTISPPKSIVSRETSPTVRHVPGSFRSETAIIAGDESANNTAIPSSRGTVLQRNDPDPGSPALHDEETAPKSTAQITQRPIQVASKSASKPEGSVAIQPGLDRDDRISNAVNMFQPAIRPKHNPFFKPYSSRDPKSESASPAPQPILTGSAMRKDATEAHVNMDRSPVTTDTPAFQNGKASQTPEPPKQLAKHPDEPSAFEVENQVLKFDNSLKTQVEKIEEELQPICKKLPLAANQRSGLKSLADLNNSSNLPSSVWSKHDMIDFINEATRLRRSLSMSSSSNTGSTGESSDMARLISSVPVGKHSYRFANTVASSSEAHTPPARHHWVHHLLGRRHSLPLREAHLTQRPSTMEDGALGHRYSTSPHYRLDAYAPSTRPGDSETTDVTFPTQHYQHMDPETISKAILELEILMRDVLQIAKQVAVEKEAGYASPASVVKNPINTIDSISYSQDPGYKRRTLPLDTAVYGEAIWATSDGNGSISEERRDFVESAIAAQERSNAQKSRLHTGSTTSNLNLNQEFQSVSAHAREVAHRLGLPDPLLQSPSNEKRQRDARRESVLVSESLAASRALMSPSVIDFAAKTRRGSTYPEAIELPELPQRPLPSQKAAKEQRSFLLRGHPSLVDDTLQNAINRGNAPQVQPRSSSVALSEPLLPKDGDHLHNIELGRQSSSDSSALSFAGELLFRRHMTGHSGPPYQQPGPIGPGKLPAQDTITTLRSPTKTNRSQDDDSSLHGGNQPRPNLRKMHHFSIRGPPGAFSLRNAHRRAPIARDWSNARKRFVATVTCLNTALLGIIIGIYAGEVPAIQYAIADENHYTILGNVVFYLGLAIPTFFFWPLPLLHGRKPYTLAALAILMPLQFPQALVVGAFRSPDSPEYRVGLLLSRSFAGVAMGFANFNFQTTLLDLFGASLQSGNPHQEVVNENDVRRHGGGMGVWLGIWTWCSIGSLGLGFFIGAVIISGLDVAWGFWITIILTAVVLLINVVTPEVRRSPYRKSMAEVPQDGGAVSRRIARGEIMMHLYQTGPLHWWEEVRAGLVLVKRMLSQPAFVVMAVYLGWIYGQIVMIIVLLGALTSRYYLFRPQYVGLCVLALSIGALIAVPFQRGNVFSRSRHHPPRTDSMTFQKRFAWTSHLVRRIVFMTVLPFGGLAYTLSSGGPPTPFILPTIFAGVIGFLSNLAIAECYGIIMETFDTSDLQPGMTGRPRKTLSAETRAKQTNFSSFPRVTAAFMMCQTFSFIIAAAATGTGGRIERRLGAQASTGVVAGVLLILTIALTAVLIRIKTVQIVPTKRWGTAQLSGPGDDWKPVIVGHPSGINRRVSLLELGAMTRWVEIRRRNKLLDEQDRRAETFENTTGAASGKNRGFGPRPGPGPSGVKDFIRNGARGFEDAGS